MAGWGIAIEDHLARVGGGVGGVRRLREGGNEEGLQYTI